MWLYQGKEIQSIEDMPEGTIGFIYLLENARTGKKYIGKKALYSERRKALTKKEKELPENKRRKWKYVKTEANWKDYNSSSKEVLEDIESGEVFFKNIIAFASSKTQLTYLEVKLQFVNEVLETEDWYNNNINSSWFRGNIGI